MLKSSLGDWSHHEVFPGASSCLAQARSIQIVNSKLMIMMIVQKNCWSNIWQKGAVPIDQIYLFPFGVGSLKRRFYSREEKWFWNRNPQTHSFSLLIRLAVDFKVSRHFVRMDVLSGTRFVRTALDICQDRPALDVLSGRRFVRKTFCQDRHRRFVNKTFSQDSAILGHYFSNTWALLAQYFGTPWALLAHYWYFLGSNWALFGQYLAATWR